MPYELDAKSIKILKKLYKKPLSDVEYKDLIGWTDDSQLNEVDSFLRKNNLIKSVVIDGVEDGAGGYIDGTVVRRYEITIDGKAEVEHLGRDQKNFLLRLLDSLLSFLPFH